MKSIYKLVLLCVVFGLALPGCTTPPRNIREVGGGYQEVTHPAKSGDPADVRISLEYRAPGGRITLVWPSLSGVDEMIHGDTALFVGDRIYVPTDPDAPHAMRPRLFAVKEPGLPLDITDEVLWGWADATGKDPAKAGQLLEMVTPVQVGNKLEVKLEFWEGGYGWPQNATIVLTWNQVNDIMRSVRERGTVHKELRWGTRYIEK